MDKAYSLQMRQLAARVRRHRRFEARKRERLAALTAAEPVTNVVRLLRSRPRRPGAGRKGKIVRVDFRSLPLF